MEQTIITVELVDGIDIYEADNVYQYDRGDVLKLTGLTLPIGCQVHFGFSANGKSKTALLSNGEAVIPQEFTSVGAPIYAWVYVSGEDYGATKKTIKIPVAHRGEITDEQPTPEQESTIDQYIALLQETTAEVEENYTELSGEVGDLKSHVNDISEKISRNLIPATKVTTTVNGIPTVYSDGTLTRNGTANNDGGRLTKLTSTFTLPTGDYVFWIATSGATLFLEKVSDNSIVATAINNVPVTFTLSADTEVYIGMNVANNTTYDDSFNIQIETGSVPTVFERPSLMSAYDSVARSELTEITSFVERSVNLLPSASKNTTVNNVACVYNDGVITRNGTSNADGGRLTALADDFILSAGTYTFWAYPTGATFFIEKKSDNTIVATAINDVPATFTLDADTLVYIGMTIVNGVTYNDSYQLQIESGSSKTAFEKPSFVTLTDIEARETANLSLDIDRNNAFASFMKFGVIGDSLAVGYTGDGVTERNPEYSWGRILARRLGNICQLFAKAGTTTKNWFTDSYCYTELIKSDNKCQAYVIGIGTNDTISASFPIGTTADIDLSDSSQNADSFCGWYGKIIQTVITFNDKAKIFLFTLPHPRVDNAKNNAIRAISELFTDNVFLVDLAKDYNDLFEADEVTDFACNSHFSAGGYANLAVINNYVLSLTMKDNASEFIDIPHIPYGNATDVE